MKKTKTQKGITLIALIITIVVLLILAVVTIRAVKDDGIIGHAQNAAEEYEIAQIKEKAQLSLMSAQMDANGSVSWEETIKAINNAFEGSRKNGNIISLSDGKYEIKVNKDYSIEVALKGTLENTYAPSDIIVIETCNTWWNVEPVSKYTNIGFYINSENLYKYAAEELYTYDEKWGLIQELYYPKYNSFEEALTDEMLDFLNNNYYYTNARGQIKSKARETATAYTTLEEVLSDQYMVDLVINTVEKMIYLYWNNAIGGAYTMSDALDEYFIGEKILNEYDLEDVNNQIKLYLEYPNGTKNQLELIVVKVANKNYYNISLPYPEITSSGKYTYIITLDDADKGEIALSRVEFEDKELPNPDLLSSRVSIGDYVAYNAEVIDPSTNELYTKCGVTVSKDIKWRVLEINKEESYVTLISEEPIAADDGSKITFPYNSTYYTDFSPAVNIVAGIFGHGEGAQSAVNISEIGDYSDENTIEYQLIYKDSTNSNYVTYILSSYKVEDYTTYYYTVTNGTITTKVARENVDSTLVPKYEYKTVQGYLRPIVKLESGLYTTGQDDNGVWQLKLD